MEKAKKEEQYLRIKKTAESRSMKIRQKISSKKTIALENGWIDREVGR